MDIGYFTGIEYPEHAGYNKRFTIEILHSSDIGYVYNTILTCTVYGGLKG
jgi:hypothetical protein